MHHVFVGFRCCHFAIVPDGDDDSILRALCELTTADPAESEELLANLWKTPISWSVRMTVPCHRSECRSATTKEWNNMLHIQIESMLRVLQKVAEGLMAYGCKYHQSSFVVRAKLANHEDCQVAHEHFGVSKIPWVKDPAFQTWLKAMEHLRIARTLIEDGGVTEKLLGRATRRLHRCRIEFNKFGMFVHQIRVGVAKIRELENTWLEEKERNQKTRGQKNRVSVPDRLMVLEKLMTSDTGPVFSKVKGHDHPPRASGRRRKTNRPPTLCGPVSQNAIFMNWAIRFHGFTTFLENFRN